MKLYNILFNGYIRDENKEYLRNLPKEITFTFNRKTIRFVHGSTRLIREGSSK